MNQEVKKQWVAALRSGQYLQGKGQLKTAENRFCCLGVLCQISGLTAWSANHMYFNRNSFLPREVLDWSGLDSHSPAVRVPYYGPQKLSELNDRGDNFNVIADLIEKDGIL